MLNVMLLGFHMKIVYTISNVISITSMNTLFEDHQKSRNSMQFDGTLHLLYW